MTRRGQWSAVLAIGVVMVWAGNAWAIYTPNPAGRWAQQRFFLAGDFQFNAEKDLDPAGEIEDVAGFFVRPAFTVAPNVILYGRIGFQDADHLDTGFAGGFGVQGAFPLPGASEWAIGGAFDFLYWDTEGRRDSEVDYVEFQITPAVSYNIPQVPALTPYAGIMFDFLSGDIDEDDPVGLLLGTNLDLGDRLRLDAQVRVISETGMLLSVGYMF